MKLQLKRSNAFTGTTSPRAQVPTPPTAPQTLDGELCVNYNDGDPALFIKTAASNIARVDGNYQAYDLDVANVAGGAKIDLIHKTSGLNISTTKHTVNFIGGTGVTITESSDDNIQISISGSSDIGVDLGYTASPTNGTVTNTAGTDATLPLANSTNAGLLAPGDKDKLDDLPALGSGEDYDGRYIRTVTAGDGIAVSTSGSDPTPTVAVDLVSNQGLEFDSSTPGDLRIIQGTAVNDALLWQITGGAQTVASVSGTSSQDRGNYQNISTTGGGGTGCTVDFDVAADSTVSNLTIQNPGSGYSESAVITVSGHGFTFTLANDAGNGRYTFTGWRTGALPSLGGGGSAPDVPDGDGVFQLNKQEVKNDYTLPEGYNAVSAGPITIESGVTVTINDGENWSIV